MENPYAIKFKYRIYVTAPMKSAILVASMASILAISMIVPAMASAATWQHVETSSITPTSSQTSTLTVVASDTIPKHTSILGGFAWLYSSGPNTAFVVVTHSGVRDSNQNPDGWHTHNVLLGAPGSNSDACIAGLSDTTAGISIQGNTVNVNVINSELTGTLSGSAKAFTIVGDTGCSSGLGVVLS
jgi:hypothetical protein